MTTTTHPRNFPWLVYGLALFLIAAVTLAPIGCVIVASAVSNHYGCALDEGSVHPCVIGGTDRGETLYTMFVLGWFMLLTLPAGAVAAGGWLLVLLLHRASWRKRRAQMNPPPLPV